MPKTSLTECQCPISYHVNERGVAVWDQEPMSVMEMCFGRCQRCGLPYHTDFTSDEVFGGASHLARR